MLYGNVDLKMYFLEIVDIYTILRMTALTFNKISGDYIGRPFKKIIFVKLCQRIG